MADFSLTTLFVAPVGQVTLPSSGSTQDLAAGQIGLFTNTYAIANAGNIASGPYFYVAQGRSNTYLQGSKRSDKIAGNGNVGAGNVTEYYKVTGCPTPVNQITDIGNWSVQCDEVVTVTLRGFSSYVNTLYFNGYTKSVTVQAPCCECGDNPCDDVPIDAFIDSVIAAFQQEAPGDNPDNISFNTFYTFQRIGTGAAAVLRITGKALTQYGQPCDVAADPFEYDRFWFRTFVYSGPATTADFIVAENCDIVATPTVIQRANYAKGTSDEIEQLQKNFYSYQAGYLKHLYRMAGYNQNYEDWVSPGTNYDTYYIKFNEWNNRSVYNWGDYIPEDATVIIAVASPNNTVPGTLGALLEAALEPALGDPVSDSGVCITTTTTTTAVAPSTTTTTSTLFP
jgi:hypothetical protein